MLVVIVLLLYITVRVDIYHKLAILLWSTLLMLSDSFKYHVQIGMSLESLGKGAVQFSQKFTFQELKDRWHSLTSHANVFVEASPRIVDSTTTPKSHILKYKVEKSVQRKRMNDGVQDCYNPMLKRVKSGVVEDGDPRSTDHGEANQNHFECVVSNCESIQQHMPILEMISASAPTTNVTESCNSIKSSSHCDEKFEKNSQSLAKETVQPCGVSNLKLNDAFCCEAETPVKSDQMSITYVKSNFSSSTLPECPIWNTSQSISKPTLPELFQVKVEERNALNSVVFSNDCDANNSESSLYNAHLDAMDQIPCHNIEILAPSTDRHLAGSSASCQDLRELEEFLFTDIDGKDIDNIPDLDTFLSDFTWDESIANVEQSTILESGAYPGVFIKDGQHVIYSSEARLSSIPAAHPELLSCVSGTHMLPSIPDANNPELHKSCAPEAHMVPASREIPIYCIPNTQILHSLSNEDLDIPGQCNDGIICCALNTEDAEIPCNDDALIKLSSRHSSSFSKKNCLATGSKTMNRAENKEKPCSPCYSIQSQILSDLGINLPFINRGA